MIPELQNILDTYKTKSNKDLSNISVKLFGDFNILKDSALVLAMNMSELETVYNAVYAELQNRLKFEENEK